MEVDCKAPPSPAWLSHFALDRHRRKLHVETHRQRYLPQQPLQSTSDRAGRLQDATARLHNVALPLQLPPHFHPSPVVVFLHSVSRAQFATFTVTSCIVAATSITSFPCPVPLPPSPCSQWQPLLTFFRFFFWGPSLSSLSPASLSASSLSSSCCCCCCCSLADSFFLPLAPAAACSPLPLTPVSSPAPYQQPTLE